MKACVFPVSNYIGTVGCGIILLFLDLFLRLQPMTLSVGIAFTRYLLVINPSGLRHQNVQTVTSLILYGSYIITGLMVLLIQLPPSEIGQASFYVCLGRFEVFFDPLHPDSVSPGRRVVTDVCQKWYISSDNQSEIFKMPKLFRVGFAATCEISVCLIYGVLTGLPQMFLYYKLYRHIHLHNVKVSSMNLLKPEVEKLRRQQGLINIHVTCVAWILEAACNILNIVYIKYLYGMTLFVHLLSSVFQLSFNYVLMPFLFYIVADVELRSAIYHGRIKEALSLLFWL